MSEIKSESITLVDIDSIIPNPKNANRHSIEQIQRLEKLITYQGFRNPLIVSNRTGFLIVGHGRLEAATNLGIEKLPVIYQDFEDEAQEYAYLISDNEIARWAELDKHLVYTELKDLDLEDIELLGLEDFELPDIDILDPQTDEDEVPEIPPEPITKRGDIWLLGKHRLMCGDSTMIDDVEKLMNDEKADLSFADPPYGIDVGNQAQGKGGGVAKKNDYGENDWDKEIPYEAISNCFLISDAQLFFGANYYADKLPPSQCWIVWDKDNGDNDFADCELAWCSFDKASRIFKWRWNGMLQEDMKNKETRVHPTQKPVAIAKWFFDRYEIKSKVVDLFGGSGSTLIACEETKRINFSMEMGEKYCDVIINRYQNYTGKTATLESTGELYNDLKAVQDGN